MTIIRSLKVNTLMSKLFNRVRIGEPTKEDIQALYDRPSSLLSEKEYNAALHLFWTNKDVIQHNERMLCTLDCTEIEIKAELHEPKGYKAKTGKYGQVDGTQLLMNLEIKLGARVMVVSNIDIRDSIVNGSLGTVVDVLKNKEGENLLFMIYTWQAP